MRTFTIAATLGVLSLVAPGAAQEVSPDRVAPAPRVERPAPSACHATCRDARRACRRACVEQVPADEADRRAALQHCAAPCELTAFTCYEACTAEQQPATD